ncbi:MAG: bifunctional phosphoribosylaminoimidazolecarboxamide formyltransferase/IMP cyclohydrolase PurH [Alphaproteobacteria bacterium]|nr:MAG: bifunctional phosphoribosylaminoimidazolecarboxamide formyltransferase/IMP cyclohydrolase PurH [Alphaproteobacteria bacterium]
MPSAPLTVRRALISVFDKTGLVPFARALADRGVDILSTGGSARMLAESGVTVVEVAEHTGFPEMMDGRLKTLHPKIHGGLLGLREDPGHTAAMTEHGIAPIDLLVVNLYPFERTVASGADFAACIENIDIGGPAMIRSAAKNHAHVAVVVDPADYDAVLTDLASGGIPLDRRRHLAAKAFARTGAYDTAIAAWFQAQVEPTATPERLLVAGTLRQALRYGENPHQSAAFYVTGEARPGVATATQKGGKELSYNNLNDTDAAYELVAEFDDPACVIVKHATPCGVAVAQNLVHSVERAIKSDPESAFGGIVALNRPLDGPSAERLKELFLEVIIAPEITDEAMAVLAAKTNLRLLAAHGLPDPTAGGRLIRTLAGGLLVQSRDLARPTRDTVNLVTDRVPTAVELRDLLMGFTVAKHCKSNAIVLVKDGMTVGIGSGQTSRVEAARQATRRAADLAYAAGESSSRAIGAVVASDAFFPFPDGLETCLSAGCTAAIQPGGAKRDEDVIAAANSRSAAMLFTGQRVFRH